MTCAWLCPCFCTSHICSSTLLIWYVLALLWYFTEYKVLLEWVLHRSYYYHSCFVIFCLFHYLMFPRLVLDDWVSLRQEVNKGTWERGFPSTGPWPVLPHHHHPVNLSSLSLPHLCTLYWMSHTWKCIHEFNVYDWIQIVHRITWVRINHRVKVRWQYFLLLGRTSLAGVHYLMWWSVS